MQGFRITGLLWLQLDNNLLGVCLHYGGTHAIQDTVSILRQLPIFHFKKMQTHL